MPKNAVDNPSMASGAAYVDRDELNKVDGGETHLTTLTRAASTTVAVGKGKRQRPPMFDT